MRPRSTDLPAWLSCLLAGLAAWGAPQVCAAAPVTACETLLQYATAAVEGGHYAATLAAVQEAEGRLCDGQAAFRRQLKAIRLRAARELWNQLLAQRSSRPPADDSPEIPARVAQIADFAHTYKPQLLLGDHYRALHAWRQAREAYARALAWAEEPPELDTEPDEAHRYEVLQMIQRRYDVTNNEAARSSSYRPDGSEFAPLAVVQRGACASSRPIGVNVPIEFEFNSDQPSARGAEFLASFVTAIMAAAPPELVLIGHTDAVGWDKDPAYQLRLSEARAQRVASALHAAGYRGRIVTRGVGYRDPIDATLFPAMDREALDQLNRRVEWLVTCP